MSMEKDLWIYAEYRDGKIAESYYELLSKAQAIVAGLQDNTKIAAVLLGSNLDDAAEELQGSGADLVYIVEHEKLKEYNPETYPAAFAALARQYHPLVIWFAASAEGAEIGPSVAAKLKTGLAAHCVDIQVNAQKEIVHMVPAFGGKLLNEILIPETRPIIASIKPGIFRKGTLAPKKGAEVIREDARILDTMENRVTLVGQQELEAKEFPVEKAEVIVSGGLGIGNMETWEKAKKLAQELGAAVGYTRPLVDLGLESTENNMIGASGKSVRPKVYLAFGISGASRHLCGMKDSGTIIAVNTDAEADIFEAADYKVVGDCDAILDALLRQLENV